VKFGSLFSGVGGFDLGFERAGMECAWQVEIDDKARTVLEHHWPGVTKYEDVRNVGQENLEPVDLICGGFPCQDVSTAGLRRGLQGKRSGLWGEFSRIICEIKPGWVVVENVWGLLSSNSGRDFGIVLRDLADGGYDAEWRVLSARQFGAPHYRERVFIVAHAKEDYGKKWLGAWKGEEIFGGDPPRGSDFWVETYGSIARMDDGIPPWFYRLSAELYGQAVMPIIAEWIGNRIMAVSE
jgi:DNA (cytosine-5)-methyltransferase 1